MERCVCIHGHFYQPPRENPWLEDIELQDSAYPYHDWDARITAECYGPNTVSRILTGDGWIKKIINNYSKISFNFGPTLLSWMEKNEPDVYSAIIESDRESQQNFSGHGSAMAQTYNHMIMPLANRRDKYTQVVWGIKDFERRFGRKPEGMWLPETAVDLETLRIMAEQNILFTVLAPSQARRYRSTGDNDWKTPGAGGIDTTIPYEIHLPDSDRKIAIFFYNGDISQAVAFEKLLYNGERFASRLLGGFPAGDSSGLVHIATDGETYGHHHRHGDMALAYALDYIESSKQARLTNYAEYLDKHPPTHEVEINENSAWSCAHGVSRWKDNCGCNSGMHPGWSQAWRAPLRNALDWLRDTVAPLYEERAGRFFKDPWAVRDNYIELVLDRSSENLERFMAEHAVRQPGRIELIEILKLLELQRHAMLMYTSCGWFFDEISGIESVQVIKYAARVIQLAQELFGQELESGFTGMLEQAKSNIPEHQNGANIYAKFVKPAMVDLLKVGAHYAICSLFETYDDDSGIYCYKVNRKDYRNHLAGASRLALGRIVVTSEITRESADLNYGVVNFGDYSANAGIGFFQNEELYQKMAQEVTGAFERAEFAEVIRLLDQHFGGANYSIKQLFRDKQRMILDKVLETTLVEIASDYRRIYERHAPLMRFLRSINIPQPKVLQTAAEFVLNSHLRHSFIGDALDLEHIKALLDEAETTNVPLDGGMLGYILEHTLERMGNMLRDQPADLFLVRHLDEVIGLVKSLPFEVDLWKVQNIYYGMLKTVYPEYVQKAGQEEGDAREWVDLFNSLGDKLRVQIQLPDVGHQIPEKEPDAGRP